jgi:hypothetical protein
MNTQHIPVCEPSNDGFTRTHLRTDIRQYAGPWREFILWLLLAAFLLMLCADAAYAADRRSSARTRSPDAGVPTYNIDAICRGAASIARLLETTAPDNRTAGKTSTTPANNCCSNGRSSVPPIASCVTAPRSLAQSNRRTRN